MQEYSYTVDVSKIYNGDKSEIPFEFCLPCELMTDGDIVFSEPVRVKGRVYCEADGRNNTDNLIMLYIELVGEYASVCARCASDVSKTFEIKTKFGVAKNISEQSTDYVEAVDGILDLGEIARTVFFLELPSKVLCREDCKGLCPVCGKNLNFGNCSCKPEKRKNALSDLKKLLDNYDEK